MFSFCSKVLLSFILVTLSKDDGITLWREAFKKVLGRVRHMFRYLLYIKQIVYDGKARQKSYKQIWLLSDTQEMLFYWHIPQI